MRGTQIRRRAIIGAMAVVAASLLSAIGGAGPVQADTTCTWGGTPVAPTGWVTISPGTTNTPSTAPADFKATGELAGDAGCNGQFTFVGQINTGSTCAFSTFQGTAMGLPGVKRFEGVGPLGVLPSRLYDKYGNVVGSENAQVDTIDNAQHFSDCSTPAGFTTGEFSSVIELFGDRW
jgi:hypothetical protein